MKFGMRTPSLKKSFKARTTGKAKRAVKNATATFSSYTHEPEVVKF